MLDQNTDRMWYVIGAVIVGAALIFLVNSSFPQLFASVGTTFENKVETVSDTINGSGNVVDLNTLTIRRDHVINNTSGAVLRNTNTWYSTIERISVKERQSYYFTAPKGLASAIVAYYDSGDKFIVSYPTNGIRDGHLTQSPIGAAYARISGGDNSLRNSPTIDVVEHWEFIEKGI